MGLCPTILVVDDELASRIALRRILAGAAYRFVDASTGAEALERIADHNCEMAVLDPALADMDGFELIRVIRRQSVMPIIVLSTSDDERSKVRAFDLGADDYVTKPFSDKELLARVRAAFRHRFQARGEQPRFVSGELEVDLVRREVRVRRRPVTLTPLQYKALSILVRYAGGILTHDQLRSQIWGKRPPGTLQPLRVIIGGLRRKIESDPARPVYLLTETRVGYRLSVRQQTAEPAAPEVRRAPMCEISRS